LQIDTSVVKERLKANGCILKTSRIFKERSFTISRVFAARSVVIERISTNSRIIACGIVSERIEASGGIMVSGCKAEERLKAERGIAGASPVASDRAKALQSVSTFSCIAVRITPIWRRVNGPHRRRQRKAAQQEYNRCECDIFCFHDFISFLFVLAFRPFLGRRSLGEVGSPSLRY
jgi:hypothetical protein